MQRYSRKPSKCPVCGSDKIASIQYGYPAFSPELQADMDAGLASLATCRFIRDCRDVLFIGPPGVGKSHLAQAIGHQAAKTGFTVLYHSIIDAVAELMQAEALNETGKILARYLIPDLFILDDMGLKKLPVQSGEYLFEIIMHRYEKRSTIMTSNPADRRMGKAYQGCADSDCDPRPSARTSRSGPDHREKLQAQRQGLSEERRS